MTKKDQIMPAQRGPLGGDGAGWGGDFPTRGGLPEIFLSKTGLLLYTLRL